eukprot:2099395-Prymnesium_polylepis.1
MTAPIVKQALRCMEVVPLRPTIKQGLSRAGTRTDGRGCRAGIDHQLVGAVGPVDGKVLHGYAPFS